MTRPRGHRYAALALVTFGLACGGDAPSAPNAAQETVVVSLVGLRSNDAGIVLQLAGAADHIESVAPSLDVAWVTDASNVAMVAIVGPLSETGDILIVRRRAGLAPLRAEVREVAGADGTVSSASSARALVRAVGTP